MINVSRGQLADTIAELIRIPSVNPDLVPGAAGERDLAELIAGRLRQTPGIEVEMQDAGGGRPNVIATVGEGGGRTLMINGHLDTVGVVGMDAPYEPRIDGNRIFGRGSSDMKASLASMILVLEEIARIGDFPGRVVATFVVDEEYASIGTQAICREIGRWSPDGALVLEPTDLNIGIAHKGFVWAEITTDGFAAHGSSYQTGVDAIARMGGVLVELERLANDLVERRPHPYVGPPSLHASLIRGGQELSSYPSFCHLELERRTIPGETAVQVELELRDILDRLLAADPQFKVELKMGLVRDPFEISPDDPLIQALQREVEDGLNRAPELQGFAGWMDAAFLSAAGVPTAIFGPGGDGMHGLEEWGDLDVAQAHAGLLARTAYAYCRNR